jgi:hypothetical protein
MSAWLILIINNVKNFVLALFNKLDESIVVVLLVGLEFQFTLGLVNLNLILILIIGICFFGQ